MKAGIRTASHDGASRATILVVDDEDQLRDFLREILERQGYAVIDARDGHEGALAEMQYKPDLLITDLVMPEKEGLALIGGVHGRRPELPIIAMSGRGGEFGATYLRTAAAFGAAVTLEKPFDPDELLHTLRALLAGRRCGSRAPPPHPPAAPE